MIGDLVPKFVLASHPLGIANEASQNARCNLQEVQSSPTARSDCDVLQDGWDRR